METADTPKPPAPTAGAAVWAGRVLTALVALGLTASAAMKLSGGGPEAEKEMARMGIAVSLLPTLAALELGSLIVYLIPRTAPFGAILLTGYMGGAIFAHVRLGEPPIPQVVIAVLAWAGLALRDVRLSGYLWQTLTGR
jgi:hypothetical protein